MKCLRIFYLKESTKMDMFEKARAMKSMMEMGNMTQNGLAKMLGITQSYVANTLRLLNFSDKLQEKILEYSLSERHARTILRLRGDDERLQAIEKVKAMNMNVSRCEIMVDTMLDESLRQSHALTGCSDGISHFEKSLESSLSLLAQSGIRARAKREEVGNIIYFTVTIG